MTLKRTIVNFIILLALSLPLEVLTAQSPAPSNRALSDLRQRLAAEPDNTGLRSQYAALLADGGQDQLALQQYEKAIEADSELAMPLNAYRLLCIRQDVIDRSIGFLEGRVAADPKSRLLRINLALAYVDKIPAMGPIGQARLSQKSVHQLESVLSDRPSDWLARYSVAMNYLHWPTILARLPLSVKAFQQCRELQESASEPKPHFVLTYIGLGDAHALDGNIDEAREVWQAGLAHFPKSPALRQRLIQPETEVQQFVENKRRLDLRIDTDMEIYFRPEAHIAR